MLLDLTRRGLKAHEGHARYHGEMYAEFIAMMKELEPERSALFGGVMERIEYYLDRYGENGS